jgi:hypothetical protein
MNVVPRITAANRISDWEAYYSTKRDGLTAVRTSFNTKGGVHFDSETDEPSENQTKAFRYNYE